MALLLKHVLAISFLVKDIPGSRKQKQLSDEELEKIAAVYRKFKRIGTLAEVPGFCRIAKLDKEIRANRAGLGFTGEISAV